MAAHPSRKRARISYKEDSGSGEDSDQLGTAVRPAAIHAAAGSHASKLRRTNNGRQRSQAQTARTAPTRSRKVSTYKELSSESSSNEEDGPQQHHEQASPRRNPFRPLLDSDPKMSTTLRRMPTKSYKLPSSDVELQGDEDYDEGLREPRPRRNRATRSRAEPCLVRETPSEHDESDSIDELGADEQPILAKPVKSKARSLKRTRANSRANPNPSTSTPRKRRRLESRNGSTASLKEIPVESDGVVPPWSTLPYAILQQIFTYASTPLCDDVTSNPTPDVTWLLNTARVCKAWAEPALTALYRCPPLLAIDKPHRLLDLLQQTGVVNYNVKIQRLEFDVIKSLAYTWTGRGHFEIGDLIPYVPQLSELTIGHPQDRPPFRPFLQSGRWHYTKPLFTALQNSEIRLKSWTWNSNLCAKDQTLSWMGGIHQIDAFQRIENLSLINYASHEAKYVEGEPAPRADAQILADNLDMLPRLKSLSFESCSILTGDLFPKLKDGLESLTIMNCHEVTSENLLPFLLSRGSELRSLILNHNRSLDISFLSNLKAACPKLEVLKMDLTYYSTMVTHDDSEPLYDDLMKETDVPTWPSTLRALELVQLRKWTSEAAETFFASLIDSADQLLDLRTLVLKVILNIGWRDRAGFRDKWIGRLQRVFLRKSTPPAAHLMSGRRFREWKGWESPEPPMLGKRLSHVAVTPSRNRGAVSDINTRSLRPRRGGRVSPIEEETSSPSEAESGGERSVQGMCEVVDVRIDNLRPREEQFNENDFLDSEVSGDEDYNE